VRPSSFSGPRASRPARAPTPSARRALSLDELAQLATQARALPHKLALHAAYGDLLRRRFCLGGKRGAHACRMTGRHCDRWDAVECQSSRSKPGSVTPRSRPAPARLRTRQLDLRPRHRSLSACRRAAATSASAAASGASAAAVAADTPVPADHDADNRTDLAVWRPSAGTWQILESRTGKAKARCTGAGQRHCRSGRLRQRSPQRPRCLAARERHVARRAQRQRRSHRAALGFGGDKPVPGEYDGDGRTDLAVWRPSSGFWHTLKATPARRTISPSA
jgi:hypothetical protein